MTFISLPVNFDWKSFNTYYSIHAKKEHEARPINSYVSRYQPWKFAPARKQTKAYWKFG